MFSSASKENFPIEFEKLQSYSESVSKSEILWKYKNIMILLYAYALI